MTIVYQVPSSEPADYIRYKPAAAPTCITCGDECHKPDEDFCAVCNRDICQRHKVDDYCEVCAAKKGIKVSSCDDCGDSITPTQKCSCGNVLVEEVAA